MLSRFAARRLKALGLSAKAVDQIRSGDVVGDARDRSFMARLLAGTPAAPRVGWDVMVRAQVVLKHRAEGMSDLGIRQLSMGTVVTDPDDRLLIAAILEDATAGARTRRKSPGRCRRA